MRKISILIIVVLCMVACKPRGEADSLSLSANRVELSFVRDTMSVVVRTNRAWRAQSQEAWCEILPQINDSTLRLAVDDNMSGGRRQAVIRIYADELSVQLLVAQSSPPGDDFLRWQDSTALMEIYNSCGGEQWNFTFEHKPIEGWSADRPITEWPNISTTMVDGSLRVVSLDLGGLGVQGALPAEVKKLDQLYALYFGSNPNASSPIELLSLMPKLQVLDISYSTFDLLFPSLDEAFAGLVYLNIAGIDCAGKFPENLDKLTDLQYLDLSTCNIGGGFPIELRGFKNLKSLNISNNNLGGELAGWIGELSLLEQLDISFCGLHGELPLELGRLTHLVALKVAVNKFTGPIPDIFGSMSSLEGLNLSECGFTTIAPSIFECRALSSLDMSFNQIEGNIPLAVLNLPRLEYLMLVGNRMSGEISPLILDSPKWDLWVGDSGICPQQVGFGFTNCNK